ncbi:MULTISPECIES: nitrogen regulation protein NR(II) [unclassified Acidiphilium]|uniref:two-component system sensor histidine kinase NtrB n=1 Tax=unclassified Acidiphilium TaxID=2617493 RepID=UPI000BD1CD34|nr:MULTISPECIES: ATP-binding protein [unclassified Acidiphilium]OYV54999.1 MAG: two-component sensor histidine kinase [Acidiphilium sp. 20-67-58]OYV86534.1 MAG: two-component sensor histidine kinase [Acidiphilium sp. 21-68-69]HQT62277.1 ATP-binding protein [Acidiphilium sp.]
MTAPRGAFARRGPAISTPDMPTGAGQLLAALPLAVIELDAEDRFLFANYAAEEMFGASQAVLAGRALHEFVPADHPIFILLDRARRDEAPVAGHDLVLEGPRFARRGVSMQAAAIVDAPGHLAVTLQDSSAARALDQQLSARNAARSITGMAAVLAHEVKNPLSGIRGAAQLLEANATPADRELAVLIRDEVDRIRDLVERIEVFGDKPLDVTAINIHRVLEHVRRLSQSGFGARIHFVETYDPSLPPVLGNRDQLVQVLLNLVKNAAEAIAETQRPDGEITLMTGFQHGVRLAASPARGQRNLPIFIAVRDNGAGIPEDIRRHLFEPFVSTKAAGSGLGLALVAKTVADHGGLINVDSRPGRTEFRIHLPQFEDRAESSP